MIESQRQNLYRVRPLLQILCRYKWHARRLMYVPTNLQMYRQNSEKAIWGGGGDYPRNLATLVEPAPVFLLPFLLFVILCTFCSPTLSMCYLSLPDFAFLSFCSYYTNSLLKSDVTRRDHVVRCHGSHECWFTHRQFHSQFLSRRHSLRITLKYTTLVCMRSSNA